MSAPVFKQSTTLTLKKGDILILPWFDGRNPCFTTSLIPDIAADTRPDKEGGAATVFAGRIKKGRMIARAQRLDARHTTPADALKKAVSDAVSLCETENMKRVVVLLDNDDSGLVHAAHEGTVTGGYRFDTYLSDKPDLPLVLAVTRKGLRGLRREIEENSILFHYCNFARDLLNEPPNVITPVTLAERYAREAGKVGLDITIWDEKKLEEEQCGGIIAVGKGAASPPRLIIAEYRPRGASMHLVLVGKGITFDTGGYCLKPSNSQIGMKYDMGGAAAVLAAGMAIASLEIPINLTVLAPLAENDISSSAYHTTDIIKMRNGTSVQVDNTDAEGRLILADALCLACEKEPDWIIDAATLTGACCVALGEDIAGLFGDDEEFNSTLVQCGRECGELYWPLPLHMPYMEELKTPAADCKNIGGKWGGALTAALFLKKFIKKEIPWIHLDIAGPAVKEEPLGHLGKGAKGFGVKTMVNIARKLGEK